MAKKRSGFYFPEELIFQILLWLPVISLLRFRLVCKSWRSMISDPELIEKHFAISHKREACVLRIPRFPVNEASWIGDFNNAFYVDTRGISVPLHLPPRFSGFCFDSIFNGYKLLRIVQSDVSYDGYLTFALKAELYSTNSNSWKRIKVPKTVKKFLPWPYSKCVDSKTGVLYFENVKALLSFDSHKEVFGVYQFPESVYHKRRSDVLDFNGSVAMIFESVCDGSVLSLWTLDDICGEVSWVKKFNLEFVHGISWIYLHLGAGQYVAQYNNGARYVFYDYKQKKTTEIPLSPRLQDLVSVVKYNDSFVSLEGFEQLD